MRLIDGEKLFEYLGDVPWTEFKKHKVLRAVYNAPTIDTEPVKHGEWEQHDGCVLCEDDDTYFYTCSCCKMAITEAERGLFNYCPNCGAKMDKEREDG